jgi:hypothetical protein
MSLGEEAPPQEAVDYDQYYRNEQVFPYMVNGLWESAKQLKAFSKEDPDVMCLTAPTFGMRATIKAVERNFDMYLWHDSELGGGSFPAPLADRFMADGMNVWFETDWAKKEENIRPHSISLVRSEPELPFVSFLPQEQQAFKILLHDLRPVTGDIIHSHLDAEFLDEAAAEVVAYACFKRAFMDKLRKAHEEYGDSVFRFASSDLFDTDQEGDIETLETMYDDGSDRWAKLGFLFTPIEIRDEHPDRETRMEFRIDSRAPLTLWSRDGTEIKDIRFEVVVNEDDEQIYAKPLGFSFPHVQSLHPKSIHGLAQIIDESILWDIC